MKQYRIIIEPEAGDDLSAIYTYIKSNDTVVQAQRFLRKLQLSLSTLEYMPERFRMSMYMEDGQTHDMVVYGYTVCYHVLEDSVHIVAIFRQRTL